MGPVLVLKPPIGMSVDPATTDHTVILVMALLMAGAGIFPLVHGIRSRRPIVTMLFLASGCMMLMEPLVDTVAGCWFAADTTIAYVGYGLPIPVWVYLTYFVYFGISGALIWVLMERGITTMQVWMVYGGEVLADLILESVLLRTGLYSYYEHQPPLIGSFPFWWAAITFALSPRLHGAQLLLIVPALLSTSAAASTPARFVINGDLGPLTTQIGGIASVALALALATVALIAQLVARPAQATLGPRLSWG